MKARTKTPARNAATAGAPGPSLEVIAKLAELLWEQAGHPPGRVLGFWRQAESALQGKDEPIAHEAKH